MTGIGVVGVGVIFGQYRDTLARVDGVDIVAVADLDPQRAADAAATIPGCRAVAPDELWDVAGVDVVLNLTIPAAHAEVALRSIAHGRAVYGEKPLAATFEAARTVVEAGSAAGLDLGCAPDTVLGTGVQTARRAVAEGRIGAPVSATATFISAGHESWHPHPDFYYRPGGGPVFDMGPYYLTSLIHLLGPVAWVQAAASRAHATRTIGSGPRAGEQIPVEVDTHVTAILGHASGALSHATFSFDAVATRAAHIEVHGTEGVLVVPDPNGFAGPVVLLRSAEDAEELPVSAGYEDAGRGVGLADFAAGHRRASAQMALHVLEVMTAMTSGEPGRVEIRTPVAVPSIVPLTPAARWRGSGHAAR